MAITKIAEPYSLTPAYNPIKFIYNSTNSNNLGFKYIYDIYESGTANKIAEYRVLPEFSTGNGIIDLTKLLQAKVTFNLKETAPVAYTAVNSYYKYDVKVGEEYLTSVSYVFPLSASAGKVQINVANTFVAGQQVNILQADGGIANPQLEGLFTVISATAIAFVVNSSFSGVTNVNIDGTVAYADNRKTIVRDIATDLNNYVFNGAIRWPEFPSYLPGTYALNGANDLFFTNQPLDFTATLSQDLVAQVYSNNGLTDTMYFQNSDGDLFSKDVSLTSVLGHVTVGPNNYGTLTVVAGALPLINPTTEYYEYWYDRGAGQVSAKYRVNIDRRIRGEEYSILFLDRMGSWSSFAFTLANYETGNVTRELFNKDVQGYISGTMWNYKTTDRGLSNVYTSVDKSIELNGNYMSEDMAAYFEELVSSPVTYIKYSNYAEDCDNPSSDLYISCNITTSSFSIFKQKNKNLIRQSINITFANKDLVNG
jgi:hypothetical protein